MGNYASCALSGPPGKVIFPSGEVRRLREPTKAAELMLEAPSHFLVDSRLLKIGRRFAALTLTADDNLEINGVYVFFPMKRLNAAATAADMAALFRGRRGFRISPESGSGRASSALTTELNMEAATPEFNRRLSMCRSRKPLLETIVEEPPLISYLR
ncbi:uncharacterized protein LOC127248862 [Andrographis paniculata]|uniref:uncharacterized protein LOC127248862 n=1 Tax=Andrographis paniculata TaxID=175694 RepID=UPI0021E9017F|nr:uncharacterized protein LOC127248862 [Andrographis paniculata]